MEDDEISLWDVDQEKAIDRIDARRKRIARRLEATCKLSFAKSGKDTKEADSGDKYVEVQCTNSRQLLTDSVDKSGELVSNVRLAADYLATQHRRRVAMRNRAIEILLRQEAAEAEKDYEEIEKKWPSAESQGMAPTELFAQILEQKAACNALLEKKNDVIATLEDEVCDSDDQFRVLIADFRENLTVLSARMETHIQTIDNLEASERDRLDKAFDHERSAQAEALDASWRDKLSQLELASETQMERRLYMLTEHEVELDKTAAEEAEAAIFAKHKLEDDIMVLRDQLHYMGALHQLNEERLDYEIHVLKKHEQENVLVKSEQKRKITTLQDNINRLRHKVGQSHKTIAKEEAALHASIANIGKQMKKLEELKKSQTRSAKKKKAEIIALVRDEVLEKLEQMCNVDRQMRRALVSGKAEKEQLHLRPLKLMDSSPAPLGSTSSADKGSRRTSRDPADGRSRDSSVPHRRHPSKTTGGTTSMPSARDISSASSSSTDSLAATSDSSLKQFLTNLVYKANFLVEENLNTLVESEATSAERSLFRLDSILATIGVEKEAEIAAVLRGKDDRKKADEILKIIRRHVEQPKRGPSASSSSGGGTDVEGSSAGASSATSSHISDSSDSSQEDEDTEDWEVMLKSIRQLVDKDRQMAMEKMRRLHATVNEVRRLEAGNERLRRQVDDLGDIVAKIGA